jgi:aspartyl-tRNA(Asn)/glutamyl-tRNA(Gln) amidotransferase subunit C
MDFTMHVTREDVIRIAELAKLELKEDEIEQFRLHLEKTILYFYKINGLDTENIEPTYFIHHTEHTLREDVVGESLPRRKALGNAKDTIYGFFQVPKVIGKEYRKNK